MIRSHQEISIISPHVPGSTSHAGLAGEEEGPPCFPRSLQAFPNTNLTIKGWIGRRSSLLNLSSKQGRNRVDSDGLVVIVVSCINVLEACIESSYHCIFCDRVIVLPGAWPYAR